MEERNHNELNYKLDLIIKNQIEQKEKYLPRKPYVDMLAPFRYAYEHPKAAIVIILGALDVLLDLNQKGIITAIITSIFKQ